MSEGRLVSTWESLIKNGDEEAEIHTLHKYDHTTPSEAPTFINQAAPVRINQSRAKAPNRDYKVYASIPDEQIGYRRIDDELVPVHDERAMSCARAILREVKPDVIVKAGDTGDLAEFSRFDADSNHFNGTVQATIDRAYRWNAELRADNPHSRIVELEGNHNRLTKFVLKNAMQLYGVKQAETKGWPVISWPFLTRMEETGTEWVSGWPANEFALKDDLLFVHGKKVRSGSSTAAIMSKDYPETNVVFGHVHGIEMHTRTTRLGKYLTAATFGTLARIDGYVPSFWNGVDDNNQVVPRYENWQQGIGLIFDYGDHYQFEPVSIRNGVAPRQGKEFTYDTE